KKDFSLFETRLDDDRVNHLSYMSFLSVSLHPPIDQVITMTSMPNRCTMNMIDFIVYIVFCLSFWHGFCPFNATLPRQVSVHYVRILKTSQSIQSLLRLMVGLSKRQLES